jgi:hypothetical protein
VRLLLVIAALALTGCSLFRKGEAEPLPVQPPGPTKPDVVATLGKDLDKTDHRVASALVAIERNADKPKVVVAESRLAQSYLPAPPQGDVEFALARAGRAGTPQGDVDYAKQMAFGRQLATAVTKAWEKLEAQQAEALRVSQLKDKRIEDLTAALKESEESANKSPLRVSAGFCFLAALGLAIVGQYLRAGACVALGGILIGISTILSSPWFIWSLIATVVVVLGLGVWVVFDMARDKVNSKPSDDVPPQA